MYDEKGSCVRHDGNRCHARHSPYVKEGIMDCGHHFQDVPREENNARQSKSSMMIDVQIRWPNTLIDINKLATTVVLLVSI
jgi:hypothetical protein